MHRAALAGVVALCLGCGSSSDGSPGGSGDPGGSDAAILEGDAASGSDSGASANDAGPRPPDAGSDEPSAPDPNLHVEGNRLVRAGQVVRLLGVDHSGAEYMCLSGSGIFEGPTDDSLATAMLTWKANSVRLPLNEDCWLGINGAPANVSGAAYQTAVAQYVATLRKHGLVVILDLHWNAPGTTLSQHQQPMADADHAPAFWKSVAGAFKGDSGVVFDLYNEPFVDKGNASTSDPWDCWLHGCTITSSQGVSGSWQSAGMQALVDAVRSTGAKNVLVAGGLAYANDLSGWLAHMPHDPLGQLAASFHLYNFNTCKDATCWGSTIEPIAKSVPVITGELGEDDCAHGFIDGYMPWADARGVSYLGWTWNAWDCKSGPSLITAYDGTATGFGAGLKAHLLSL